MATKKKEQASFNVNFNDSDNNQVSNNSNNHSNSHNKITTINNFNGEPSNSKPSKSSKSSWLTKAIITGIVTLLGGAISLYIKKNSSSDGYVSGGRIENSAPAIKGEKVR